MLGRARCVRRRWPGRQPCLQRGRAKRCCCPCCAEDEKEYKEDLPAYVTAHQSSMIDVFTLAEVQLVQMVQNRAAPAAKTSDRDSRQLETERGVSDCLSLRLNCPYRTELGLASTISTWRELSS